MVSRDTQKDKEIFSGDELDETKSEEAKVLKGKQDDLKGAKNKRGERIRRSFTASPVALFILIAICILIGTGFLYLKKIKPDISYDQNKIKKRKIISSFKEMPLSENQLFTFNSFIIPIREKEGFTYFFLSISLNMPNKGLKEELIENEAAFRGIIFDKLREEMSKKEGIPLFNKIKEFIAGELNKHLSTGVIKEVYITKFLAV